MANLVKPPFFQGYEYDPTWWESVGLPSPVLFMPLRGPGRKGGVNDESGHGNDGTLNGGASWANSANGMALSFTGGTTSGVTVSVPVPSSWSWFAWISPSNPVKSYGNLFARGSSNGFWLSNSPLRLDYYDASGSPDHWANTGVVFGAWQMVGATYTPTTQFVGTLQFYYNGLSNGSYSGVNQLPSPVTGIGQDNGTGGGEGYAGLIGQEIFLPAVLSATQVQQLYQNPWGMFRAPPKRFSTVIHAANTYNETGSGGAFGGSSATSNVIYSLTANGGALGDGADVTSATYNPTASGGALADGTTSASADYNPTAFGGMVADGSTTFTYNETGAGSSLGDGVATADAYYNPTASGGATTNGSGIPEEFDSITATGGSLAGGEAVVTASYQPIASGGAVTNGSYLGGRFYREVGSGGGIANGTAALTTAQIFVQVASCSNGQKCGFSNDNQFCADELLVQGYGSKLAGAKSRNPSAYPLDPRKAAYGSAAIVPAVTLCRQKIRLRPQDQPPRKIVSKPPSAASSSRVSFQMHSCCASL